jgi:ATP-dependent RNA helicase HelY
VIVFSPDTAFADMARVALAPPPDLHSTFRPTYNLTANLVARFDRQTAHEVLSRSYAQFETDRRSGPARRPLTEALARRLGVLEELGYVDGWSLTPRGAMLRGVYHESDLLVGEAVCEGLLDDLEPSLVAAVLSGFVFEPRRARRAGHGVAKSTAARPRVVKDRLGQSRRATLDERAILLARLAARVSNLEDIHLVPHTKAPESQAASAVAAWARGAPLGDALAVVARDAGEIAPGDFVRVVRQVADLCEQVARLAASDATRAAAEEAATQLVRSVVAHVPAAVTSPRRVGI